MISLLYSVTYTFIPSNDSKTTKNIISSRSCRLSVPANPLLPCGRLILLSEPNWPMICQAFVREIAAVAFVGCFVAADCVGATDATAGVAALPLLATCGRHLAFTPSANIVAIFGAICSQIGR